MKFGVKNKREINWAKEGCKILVKKGDNQGGKNGGEIEGQIFKIHSYFFLETC